LEEEKRRREREQKDGGEGAEGAAPTQEAVMTDAGGVDEDEEAMLAEAIALSMASQSTPVRLPPHASLFVLSLSVWETH
jgi:hypothetical protein